VQLALHRPEKGGRITRRSRNDGRRHKARLRAGAVELGRLSRPADHGGPGQGPRASRNRPRRAARRSARLEPRAFSSSALLGESRLTDFAQGGTQSRCSATTDRAGCAR
jgi:hypothetical protein